jgi:hypothetical protein
MSYHDADGPRSPQAAPFGPATAGGWIADERVVYHATGIAADSASESFRLLLAGSHQGDMIIAKAVLLRRAGNLVSDAFGTLAGPELALLDS